jgi:hypothetical protein
MNAGAEFRHDLEDRSHAALKLDFVLDTDPETLRIQARLMQRLSPDERLHRVFAWSAELLQASRRAWLSRATSSASGGRSKVGPEPSKEECLEAWLRAQHGDAIAPGFAAAYAAWERCGAGLRARPAE